MWRFATTSKIEETFSTNRVVIEHGQVRYRITPGGTATTTMSSDEYVLSGYVVPSVFGPVTSVWEQLIDQRTWLRADVERHWFRAQDAWFIGDEQQWVEPAVFVDGVLHAFAVGDLHSRLLEHVNRRGIPWIVRLERGTFEVIDVPSSEVRASQSFVCEPVAGRCALTGMDDVCELRGGPWTNASRSAAGEWFHQRDRLIAALGCEVCGGDVYSHCGSLYAGSPVISITEPSVPTRWMYAEPL